MTEIHDTVTEQYDGKTPFGTDSSPSNYAWSTTKTSYVDAVNIGSGLSQSYGALLVANPKTFYLPAAGRRNDTGAVHNNSGAEGFYWTSSQYDDSKSYDMSFSSPFVFPSGATYYTHGNPVRCVR